MNSKAVLKVLAAFSLAACSSPDSTTQPAFSPEMIAAAGAYQLSVVNGGPPPQDLGAVAPATCPHVIADAGTLTLSYGPNTDPRFTLAMTAHGTCSGQPSSTADLGFTFSGTWSLSNGALTLRADPETHDYRITSSTYNGGDITANVAWSFPQTTLTYSR